MVFSNGLLFGASAEASAGGGGFDTALIPNSIQLNGTDERFSRNTSGSPSTTKLIMACWFQLTKIPLSANQGLMFQGNASGSGSDQVGLFFSYDSAQIEMDLYFYCNGKRATPSMAFRDIGWYHILASYDLGQSGTAKGKLFINGVEITSYNQDLRASYGTSFNSTATQQVGGMATAFFPGYIAQPVMLDGQSVQAGDVAITDFVDAFTFGTNGSQFVPKANSDIAALATTAGGISFCLDFETTGGTSEANLGLDISDNSNNLTPANMAASNQSVNTPSKVYPTVNPITFIGSATSTLEEGNTKATVNDNGGIVISQPLPFYDLWYFEVNVTSNTGWYPGIGQQSALGYNSTGAWNNTTAETHVWLSDHSGNLFNNNGTNSTYPVASPTTGRFAVAWDGDNRALYFGQISGSTITWTNSGDPTSGSSKTGAAPGNWPTSGTDTLYFITLGGGTSVMEFDFVSGDWTGSTNRPAAAKELNSANLTAPDFQGIDYFNAVLYTGNGTAIGSGGKAVTGVGFKPDWTWIKNRDATDSHSLYDIVRGVTKQIETNTATVESTQSEGLTTFGSDGFTVGSLAQVNTNTENYVSWNWLGSNTTSTTSPAGSIASTSSVADAGHFSVVKYTGSTGAARTVGHGLGGVAEAIIVHNLGTGSSNWPVLHKALGSVAGGGGNYILLNNASVDSANINYWNDTSPTDEVFTIGSGGTPDTNAAQDFIAYCFRSVPGVCKVGSYIANNSLDGPYLSFGFTPRYFLLKNIDGSNPWMVYDSARDTHNPTVRYLQPNDTAVDLDGAGTRDIDLLADGVKLRENDSDINAASGNEFIYIAMADIGGGGTLPPIYGR